MVAKIVNETDRFRGEKKTDGKRGESPDAFDCILYMVCRIVWCSYMW